MAIEYDADTKQLMKQLKEDDAMSVGRRAQTHQQLAFADALKSAGENGGGAGMAFLGMGMNAGNMMMGGMGQPMYGQPQQPMYGQPMQGQYGQPMQGQYGQPMQGQYGQPMQGQPYPQQPMQGQQMPQQPAPAPAAEDPTQKLIQMKQLLDAGVISQAEFDAAKAKFLGL